MSNLPRSHLIPCHRCSRPCDAFMLLAKEEPKPEFFDWLSSLFTDIETREVQFCTWYCASQYHKCTGNQIYDTKLEVVITQNKPLWEEEYGSWRESGLHRRLLESALLQITWETLNG